jgi:ABC-type transport system substrate-binding protein
VIEDRHRSGGQPGLLGQLRRRAHLEFRQKTPATDWERRIDELIVRQIAAPDPAERKRLYDQIQEIFADHLPMVYFAAPRIFVASSVRTINVTPALLRPQLLWAPETVAVVH